MKLAPLLKLGLVYTTVGVAAGTASGLFGVGGGILMVPAAVLLLGVTQQIAEGTSLLVIVPTALVGAIVYCRHGNADFKMAAGFAVGALVGAYLIGAPLAQRIPADKLKLLFGLFMILVGLKMSGAFEALGSLFHR